MGAFFKPVHRLKQLLFNMSSIEYIQDYPYKVPSYHFMYNLTTFS